jgi:hypothetical protein
VTLLVGSNIVVIVLHPTENRYIVYETSCTNIFYPTLTLPEIGEGTESSPLVYAGIDRANFRFWILENGIIFRFKPRHVRAEQI